jgi:AmmeMemoRadiSam system protein A
MPALVGQLTTDQQDALLKLARQTAAHTLGKNSVIENHEEFIPGRYGGVFVTFWNGPDLRGCVGSLSPTDDLLQIVPSVTRSSLTDRRFTTNPIHAEELESLKIEISVLSELERVIDPVTLTPGTHGVLIRRGQRSGCFLPKVAGERGWSTDDMLSNCCRMKAGLDAEAWRLPDTEIYSFTALVFSDSADSSAALQSTGD